MIKKYLMCGLTGWCMEVFWTGLGSAIKKDKKLTSNTSIWMFPIYATAIIIEPLSRNLNKKGRNSLYRGFTYAMLIFATEYLTGTALKKRGCCPWDYSHAKSNINGVIRLDYFPAWFTAGLVYEKLLTGNTKKTRTS
jgi:uncharacterized membrane protein